jgi:protein subunit release factor A
MNSRHCDRTESIGWHQPAPFNRDDLLVEPAYPRPPTGGQSVGMPNPTIKVTHLPSGNIAIVGSERSQQRNRDLAISMLEWMYENMSP